MTKAHNKDIPSIVNHLTLFNIVFIVLASISLGFGQEAAHVKCASEGNPGNWLRHYVTSEYHARSTAEILLLPIRFHTLGTDAGEGHYSLVKLHESMCRLNEDFAPYDIQFYLDGNVEKINRTRYYEHDNWNDPSRMMDIYNDPAVINVYITKTAPNNACGYWLQEEDAITVIKNCMGANAHTLTHEVGHWLALPHPFSGWEGKTYDPSSETPLFHNATGGDTSFVESVSGKNCDRAGDLICDTGPDYLSISWDCNGDRESLQLQIDPFNTDFRSDATNFMCYSLDRCQSGFSQMQVDVMRAYAGSTKESYLNLLPILEGVSEEPVKNLSPSGGEQVKNQSILLRWDAHPNATSYLIQISKFSFFASIDFEFIVDDPEINIGDLDIDKNYYWRVKPFNPFDLCTDFTVAEGGFETVEFTSTHQLESYGSVDIYPTLISDMNPETTVFLHLQNVRYSRFQLLDAQGRLLSTQHLDRPRDQEVHFDLTGLPLGTYFLTLQSDKGRIIQTILKQ